MATDAGDEGVPAYVGTGLELAIRELKQVCRVSKEMKRLIATVERIKAVMKDADRRQISSHGVRLWFQEAKQILLDAEDLIEEIATDAAVRSMGAPADIVPTIRSMANGWLHRLLMSRANRRRIREIESRLDRIQPHTAFLGLQASAVEGRRVELSTRRQTGSLLPGEASVIGRDGEKKRIMDVLFSSTQVVESSGNIAGLSVLPIIGMGGIGKTTLAQLVFNDHGVKRHFAELMMWICVSNDFDPERLTREMVEAALAFNGRHEPYQVTNWDSMQRRLLQEVQGKTFLLVLDDVWEAEQDKWEELFKPLRFGKKESRVIVTARSRIFVDKIPGWMDPPIELEGMSDTDIWSLFQRYAFSGVIDHDGTVSAEYADLEPIGRSIVRRLKGSPLAARTIGSLLNNELDVQHWKRVLESEFWRLEQGEGGILPALQLSYQYLCGEMKQCFAYCSLFPKDYRFSRDKVVQTWEAQSFFSKDVGRRMVKMGSKYFDELLYWSFFNLVSNDYGDYGYVMHDLVHDLAEYVSRDDCYRLEDQKLKNIPDTVRHISVCVTKFGQVDVKQLCCYPKLRTLLILTRNPSGIQSRMNCDLDELFLKLKMLRVLGLCDCGITELPGSIGNLKHLRYIDLEGNDHLRALPESLGNLYNLQVLNLNRCHSLFALPATTSQLVNLRHLRATYKLVSSVNGLGKLTGLQELEVRGTRVRELQGMDVLRDLTINELKEVESKEEVLEARLHSMEHLQSLQLDWCYKSDKHSPSQMTFWGRSRDRDGVKELIKPELEEEVLGALRPGVGIRELHIRGYGGVKSPDWMEVPLLASYSSLRSVRLGWCPNWRVLPSSLSQLRHLESLVITSMPEWLEWSCPAPQDGQQFPRSHEQDHSSAMLFFPCLRELEIKCCPKLNELLPVTPALRRLHLERVGASVLPGLWGRGAVETATSLSSHSPLVSASLTTLHICGCHNLTSIGGLLQHHLPNLEEVLIRRCYKLVGLPKRGFRHLTSLKRLHLFQCPKLIRPLLLGEEGDEDVMTAGCGRNGEQGFNSSSITSNSQPPPTPLPSLLVDASTRVIGGLPSSLEHLTITAGDDDYLDHGSLSTGLQELTSLKCLTLEDFENLSSLPNLSGLTSLKTMEIEHCPSLIQLWPTSGLPPSLENLRIHNCPALTRDHKRLDRSLWPEVSHVPSVLIDGHLLK